MGLRLPDITLSHWNKMVECLQQSSDEFYTQTSKNLDAHQLKGVKLERVYMAEGGLLSANREYLQIKNRDLLFHVCAAPYGNGFFVSSWLGTADTGFWAFMAGLPLIGPIIRFFRRAAGNMTFYEIDTAEMFLAVVHGAVTKALDAVLKAKGLRSLTEAESKPVMRDIFERLK